MKLYTIGFTEKSAEDFFSSLLKHKVKTVIDVRLKNNGMFAGFTKQENFPYFLKQIGDIDYIEMKSCSPTDDLLNAIHDDTITWAEYKKQYLRLLKDREVIGEFSKKMLNRACLLCAEPEPKYCHRRLLAEYLAKNFEGVTIEHL